MSPTSYQTALSRVVFAQYSDKVTKITTLTFKLVYIGDRVTGMEQRQLVRATVVGGDICDLGVFLHEYLFPPGIDKPRIYMTQDKPK